VQSFVGKFKGEFVAKGAADEAKRPNNPVAGAEMKMASASLV
jgi:hypothetical protein